MEATLPVVVAADVHLGVLVVVLASTALASYLDREGVVVLLQGVMLLVD